MLAHRLVTGSSLILAVAAVLGLDEALAPWYPFWFITAMVIMGAAALEMVDLLKQTSARPSGNTVFAGVLVMVVANWAPHIVSYWLHDPRLGPYPTFDPVGPIHSLAWPLCVYVAVLMCAFVAQGIQFQGPGGTMAAISGTVLATSYIGLLGSFIIQTRWIPGKHAGLVAVATLIAAAKGADTGAYTLGRLAGRHKLWPRLSPNKTVEGALGGLIFGAICAVAVVAVGRFVVGVRTLSWPAAIGYGIVVGSVAQLGDLMESMIKRDCARKDASDALPGFGGVLDVMDSLLFASPVALGYWLLFGP
jgi:phosphatidate cytidylyltransferase